ncbi:MAG: hydroxymethylbilane synthase [Devosiaceae bacterium]|nr:hydroxymethylbilane synthase [Devosiaceae bacterium MH13]
MSTPLLTLGTRGSALALAQAYETRDRLVAAHGCAPEEIAIEVFSTRGDEILDKALTEIGGKGLFTEELEASLHGGGIDFAVHSSKDMPTELPDGLELSIFLPREDVRDVFITRNGETLETLPQGAVVGTASLRRAALVKRVRPDLRTEVFRGNVQTRLQKLADGVVDATLLAHAGLKRLGLRPPSMQVLDPEAFPPALAQGAIGIETRTGDARVRDLLAPIADTETGVTVACERAFLSALDGSCRTPIAGHATLAGDSLELSGIVLKEDGSASHTIAATGVAADAEAFGRATGAALKAKAGAGFLPHWTEGSA